MPRLPRALYLTLPLSALVAAMAARDVRRLGDANRSAVVATFAAQPSTKITFPDSGAYWLFAAAASDNMRRSDAWTIQLFGQSGVDATVTRASARRAKGRDTRSALDLIAVLRIPLPGAYDLRLTGVEQTAAPVNMRVTRAGVRNAGTAVRAFGLAVLFSCLVLASAVIWFRRP